MSYARRSYGRSHDGFAELEEGGDRGKIRKAINVLGTSFGRRLDPDMVNFWISQLEPMAGQRLYTALALAAREERFPNLGHIISMATPRADTMAFKEHRPLTDGEHKKSSIASVFAMLWLHYTRDIPLSDFDGSIIARLFRDQNSDKNPSALLQRAKEKYPKETILKWMDDEIARGN